MCSVCSKYTQRVFLISQTQYFLITLWVYFLWATQAKCDYINSVYSKCAGNMPTQCIVITWLSIFWMQPQRSGSNTCWSLSLGNLKSIECLLMGHIVVTWSSTFWIFSQLTELENCKYIVQCILKELSIFWFRKVLVFWTQNHHVLSMYWLSTGRFVPSDKMSSQQSLCRRVAVWTVRSVRKVSK